MNDDRLPEYTVATMNHGRTTVQAWWRESGHTESGRALSWGVNGEEVDHNRMREAAAAGDPAAATLIGFWRMATAHHVTMPWRLTDYGKELAGECPCGRCTWTDPPARKPRKATQPVKVTSRMRRDARIEARRVAEASMRWYEEQLAAAARREREAELDAREQRRLRDARFKRLLAEARAEREAELAAARVKAQASVDRLAERIRRDLGDEGREVARQVRRVVGQSIKAGAPAPAAADVRKKRSRAGKARAAGAERGPGGRFVKKEK